MGETRGSCGNTQPASRLLMLPEDLGCRGTGFPASPVQPAGWTGLCGTADVSPISAAWDSLVSDAGLRAFLLPGAVGPHCEAPCGSMWLHLPEGLYPLGGVVGQASV